MNKHQRELDKAYAAAVPQADKVVGHFSNFYSAATILRVAHSLQAFNESVIPGSGCGGSPSKNKDSRYYESIGDKSGDNDCRHSDKPSKPGTLPNTKCKVDELDRFFARLDEIEVGLRQDIPRTLNEFYQPTIVVVEGLDGCGKTTLVHSLAESLDGGRAYQTPPASLASVRPIFDQHGGAVARAFYTVSNYVLQQEILQHCSNAINSGGTLPQQDALKATRGSAIFVVDRWFSSTCAYSLAWKNTSGGPESIDSLPNHFFQWPTDLIRPQLQIVLHVPHAVQRERLRARKMQQQQDDEPNENKRTKVGATKGLHRTVDPWDVRLSRDVDLGRRILRAHARNAGPREQVLLDAGGTKEQVLCEALKIVGDKIPDINWKSKHDDFTSLNQSPLEYFRFEAMHRGLADAHGVRNVSLERPLFSGNWEMQVAQPGTSVSQPPTLEFVQICLANDSGIWFYPEQGGNFNKAEWESGATTIVKPAFMVCVLGCNSLLNQHRQKWQAEGIMIENTQNLTEWMEITGQVHSLKDTRKLDTKDSDGKRTENVQTSPLVTRRFLPFHMKVLVADNSVDETKQEEFEWSREPWIYSEGERSTCSNSSTSSISGGWKKAVRAPRDFRATLLNTNIKNELKPVNLVLMGTHCAGKKTIGMRLSQILGFQFQPELGDVLRGPQQSFVDDGHIWGDSTFSESDRDKSKPGMDWDDRIFSAECQRDEESQGCSRIVETWHVGNLLWALQRQHKDDYKHPDHREQRDALWMDRTKRAISRARQTGSVILLVFLEIDLKTCLRRRKNNPADEARIPMKNPLQGCARLHNSLQERGQDLLKMSRTGGHNTKHILFGNTSPPPPILFVSNSTDGEQGIRETCCRVVRFVLSEQWRCVGSSN